MSFVITVMVPNDSVIMYGDKRVVTKCNNDILNTSDEFSKIKYITANVICGITGNGGWANRLFNSLISSRLSKVIDLIELVKNYPYQLGLDQEGSTVILGGIFDDGLPFVWCFKTCGKEQLINNSEAYIFAGSYSDQCYDYLFNQLDIHEDIHRGCIDTIRFASNENPVYISSVYDTLTVEYKPEKK